MSILIKNGTIVTAEHIYQADIYIEDEIINTIGKDLSNKAEKIIDATGLYVLPGGVDPHCHIQMDFGGAKTVDNYKDSHIASAFGGTTTIIDIAFQEKGKTLQEAINKWELKASGKAVIDYSFHAGIIDPTEQTLDEMSSLVDKGIPSFKVFLSNPGTAMINDNDLLKIFQHANELNSMIVIHAENGEVTDELALQAIMGGKGNAKYFASTRPPETEVEAVDRAIRIAEITNTQIFFYHITTQQSVERIRNARAQGNKIYAETCPHYLFLTNDLLKEKHGSKYIVYPPLRETEDKEALWKALSMDDLQVVSSDHCAYNYKGQKDCSPKDFRQVPGGLPGVETRVALLYSGGVIKRKLNIKKFVQLISTNPAKIFGMYPKKGVIAVGSDADLVLWDTTENWIIESEKLHMKVDYSPFEGIKIHGRPYMVLSRGKVIVKEDTFLGEVGSGKFIKRATGGAL